jgi:hypothetical protein
MSLFLFEDIEVEPFIFPKDKEVRRWLKESKGRLSFAALKVLNVKMPETILLAVIDGVGSEDVVNTILEYIGVKPRKKICDYLTPQQEKYIFDNINAGKGD